MYNTAKRVGLVKKRMCEMGRQRLRRSVYGLSALCLLLCAGLAKTAGVVIGPGRPAAQGGFGAMLLREDAGGYVLVAVAAFAAAAAITALCIRCRQKQQRKDGTGETNQQEQERTR